MHFHHQSIRGTVTFDRLLRVLYPNQTKYRLAAACFLSAIASKPSEQGLDGYELNKMCKEKKLSRATMQKVFIQLRGLGLVDRREARYFLNAEFATALRNLSESWRKMKDTKEFDFDETALKVNV